MGQLVIEVPQNVHLNFSVNNASVVEEILLLVKKSRKLETINLDLPYDLSDVNPDEAIGIWADRQESAEDIARTIRDANNSKND